MDQTAIPAMESKSMNQLEAVRLLRHGPCLGISIPRKVSRRLFVRGFIRLYYKGSEPWLTLTDQGRRYFRLPAPEPEPDPTAPAPERPNKRRYDCRSYDTCLDRAARRNGAMRCDRCKRYEQTTDEDRPWLTDSLTAVAALWSAVFEVPEDKAIP